MATTPMDLRDEVTSRSPAARTVAWPVYTGALLTLATLLLAFKLQRFWQARFEFDDAYMYSRYVWNFRHGWGMAWNAGGPHTFGITSLPWFFVILGGSYLLPDNRVLLTMASCGTGLVAIAALSLLVCRAARSSQLRQPLLVFPALALPLLLNWRFCSSWSNGMETMLGMLGVVVFLGAHRHFAERTTWVSVVMLSLGSLFCVLVRPELLLVVVALPVLSQMVSDRRRGWGRLLRYGGLLAVLLGAVLLGNRSYFGTPVPLAFYLKAMHGYDGYRLFINPWALTATFVSIALPFVAILAGLTTRRDVRRIAPYALTLLLQILYLATVTQIMGAQARYYIPLLPLILLPAMLVLDGALLRGAMAPLTQRRVLALVAVVLLSRDTTEQLTWSVGKALVTHTVYYAKPVFLPVPSQALPQGSFWRKAADLAQQMPAGTVFAASEVGILGASAPQVSVIDLAGLNDAHLALHPGDVDYVLSQKPDVIWMPHADYTKFYGSLAAAPQLLKDYDLYGGALDFGLAIRRTSRARPEFEAAIERGWRTLYPGYAMENYKVQQVQWDPHARLHGTAADVLE